MTCTGVIIIMANRYSAFAMFQTLYRENILQKSSSQQVLPAWGTLRCPGLLFLLVQCSPLPTLPILPILPIRGGKTSLNLWGSL